MHADVHVVLVTDIKRDEFAVSRAKCSLVRHDLGRSECLAENGSNLLGALSRIEYVDSKSHKVKH